MAAAKLSTTLGSLTDIQQLQLLFGNIPEDDCRILLEEYGGENLIEVTEKVYEAVETSPFTTVGELVWHIKQDPAFGVRRSSSLHERNSRKDSWCLARSKSSNTVSKKVNNFQNLSHPSSPTVPHATGQPMPFSGTKNPVQILRTCRLVDQFTVRPFLTKYMQDTETRNFIYDVYENRSEKLLILMRGASGSGKSTLASIIWAITERGEICSADHYFINRQGQYNFNRSSLGEAHESCRNHCKTALGRGDSPIVIDNTNTKVEEMMPYVQMAVEYNYEIKIIEPKTDWKAKPGILAKKTIHGVPKRTIEDQLNRFEKTSEKILVENALKRLGANKRNYKTTPDLEWGFAPSTSTTVESWTTPARAVQTASLGTMMNSLSMASTSNKSKIPPSPSSPIPLQSPQLSWSEPPPVAPPSPLLLSDLMPDLKHGKNGAGQKPYNKRAAKGRRISTNSNGNTTQDIQTVVFEDPLYLEFEKLRGLFPSVSKEKLEQIFNLYEGDVDLCASALMDQGIEMTGTLDQGIERTGTLDQGVEISGTMNQCSKMNGTIDQVALNPNEDIPQADCYADITWESNCNSNPYNNNDDRSRRGKLSSSTEDDEETKSSIHFENYSGATSTDEESDYIQMNLPEEFARTLLSNFGHPEDEKRPLSLEELTVSVPADTAFEIYKLLYVNMHKYENESARSNSSDGSTRSNSPTDGNEHVNDDEFNAIAISLSQMELETSSGDPQLNAIIDIETKINQQTQETLRCYSAPHRSMAQNISFSMLKQEYPHLDSAVINEVYTQCFLNVEKTKSWLNEMYPQSAAHVRESKTAPVTSTWMLMYNPKDVQLYTPDDIKTVEKKYDVLEHKWLFLMGKMKDCYNKCKTVSDGSIRGHYITEAKTISNDMKKLTDEMQYYKAICMNAKHKNDQVLDLHGLKINGAMRVLKEFLQFKEEEFSNAGIPKMILLIITGQGKHSRNGCPVLQPAVRNFLSQREYRFHEAKPGTYTVILTGNVCARQRNQFKKRPF